MASDSCWDRKTVDGFPVAKRREVTEQKKKRDMDFYAETKDDGVAWSMWCPAELQRVDSARHHSYKLCKKTQRVRVLSDPSARPGAPRVSHVRTLKVHLSVAVQVDVA